MEIFVGNLPFDVTEQDIREKFAECGEVSNIKMLFDKMSGRFRGIAFVSFEDDSQARDAVANLNGVDFGGRPMRIDFSKGIERRFNGFGGGFAPKKKFFKNDNRDFPRENFDNRDFPRGGFEKRERNFDGENREGGFQRKPFFKKRPFKPFGKFRKFDESNRNESFEGARENRGDSFENENRNFRQNRGGFKPRFGGFKSGGGFKGGFKGAFKGGFKRKQFGGSRDNFGGENSFRPRDDFGDE